MLVSLWQIDFIGTSTLRLLNYGDLIQADVAPAISQRVSEYAAIGAAYGETYAEGGALIRVDWQVLREHASHADLRSFTFRHAAAFPSGQTGILRMTTQGGDTWELSAASLSSCSPMPTRDEGDFATITAYSATGGALVATQISMYEGITWPAIPNAWNTISSNWETY